MAAETIAMAGFQYMGSRASGKAQKRAYEAEAKRVEMQAKVDEIGRRRELDDALAMQAVMFSSQGRQAGTGSALAITTEDKARAAEDIKMIKAGMETKTSGLKAAGSQAKRSATTSGAMTAMNTLLSGYRTGAFSGKQVK